ncbi:MAG: hypothetical protein ACFFEF_01535 [Candidatus Thorarchaeota archaeon]
MDETNNGEVNRPCLQVLSDPNRGKLVFDWRAVSRRPLKFLRVSSPLLTAHHPYCPQYDGHVFSFLGRKWCIGCFFNTLSFFLAFFVSLILWFWNPLIFDRRILFFGGVAGVLISLLMSTIGLTDNKKIKAAAKLILGSSFAAVVVSILIAGDDPLLQLDAKLFLIILLYLPIIGIMSGKRLYDMQKECEACEYRMRWSKCPGFKDVLCEFIEQGFMVPRLKVAD